MLKIFFYFLLPLSAFAGGFYLTERMFRLEKIPFPFELFGVTVGLGFFFWVLGVGFWVHGFFSKGRGIK